MGIKEVEDLAKESRVRAIQSAAALFNQSDDSTLVEVMIDSIITATMMEISAMQMKIVQGGD